jgi:hypothetical protein
MSSTGRGREVKFRVHGMDVSVHFRRASYVIGQRWLAPISKDTVVSVRILNGRFRFSLLYLRLLRQGVMHCRVLRR